MRLGSTRSDGISRNKVRLDSIFPKTFEVLRSATQSGQPRPTQAFPGSILRLPPPFLGGGGENRIPNTIGENVGLWTAIPSKENETMTATVYLKTSLNLQTEWQAPRIIQRRLPNAARVILVWHRMPEQSARSSRSF
jgi:hypothetical protein